MLGKANQMKLASKWRYLCAILLFILVISATIQLNLSYEFPNLGKLLESTGLNGQEIALTKKEIELIELITSLYEAEADLHLDEEELLDEVGLSKPDGKQKGTLQRMYNTHILNLNRLVGLTRQLKQEIAHSSSSPSPSPSTKMVNQHSAQR